MQPRVRGDGRGPLRPATRLPRPGHDRSSPSSPELARRGVQGYVGASRSGVECASSEDHPGASDRVLLALFAGATIRGRTTSTCPSRRAPSSCIDRTTHRTLVVRKRPTRAMSTSGPVFEQIQGPRRQAPDPPGDRLDDELPSERSGARRAAHGEEFADVAGREGDVIAGSDCGFGTWVGLAPRRPRRRLRRSSAPLVEGAQLHPSQTLVKPAKPIRFRKLSTTPTIASAVEAPSFLSCSLRADEHAHRSRAARTRTYYLDRARTWTTPLRTDAEFRAVAVDAGAAPGDKANDATVRSRCPPRRPAARRRRAVTEHQQPRSVAVEGQLLRQSGRSPSSWSLGALLPSRETAAGGRMRRHCRPPSTPTQLRAAAPHRMRERGSRCPRRRTRVPPRRRTLPSRTQIADTIVPCSTCHHLVGGEPRPEVL